MRRLLWVGDAACPSGFALATHKILDGLQPHYDITVLGINYRGDPGHGYPYPIYPALANYEPFGTARLHEMCDIARPDLIVVQQDGWNVPMYVQTLRIKRSNGEYASPEHAAIPVVAAVAVDGKNFQGEWLEGVSHAVFWTQFALDEAREGGYNGPASVIPLGVDLTTYYPDDRAAALRRLKLDMLADKFIVGNINRNQPRKRWDLTLRYFAEWVRSYKVLNAQLFLHAAPTGDMGIDVLQLARYYGIYEMLAFRRPEAFRGVDESVMRDTYNIFNVAITTTQGEGFGLTTLEAMACGVPCIVPDWAALGEWAKRGAWVVPCKTTATNPIAATNVIGGVIDRDPFIHALQRLYVDGAARAQNAKAALECAEQDQFRWENIGQRWAEALATVGEGHEDQGHDDAAPQGARVQVS